MSSKIKTRWRQLRDEDSKREEQALRSVFPGADAYRYNSASIRVRVVDERFKGKSPEDRDAMVEPLLRKLPQQIQSDIINLITLFPGETAASSKASMADAEFEDPTPSRL